MTRRPLAPLLLTALALAGCDCGDASLRRLTEEPPPVPAPQLCVSPGDGLDFGGVEQGSSKTLSVTLTNCGDTAFDVTALGLTQDGLEAPVDFSLTPPTLPASLPVGAKVEAQVVYAPSAIAAHTGLLAIRTSFNAGRLSVKGSGVPANCGAGVRPVARLVAYESGSATPLATDAKVAPLTTVALDATGSTVPRGGATFAWTTFPQPQNGIDFVRVTSPGKGNLRLSLAGDYTVSVVVTDALGCPSEPATLVLHSAPKKKLLVQLTWAESWGDVDLHLIGPGGTFADAAGGGDCFWDNCMTSNYSSGLRNDWGAGNLTQPDGNKANDPSLDIDNMTGNGPETITIEQLFDGTYEVDVHYCRAGRDGSGLFPTGPAKPATAQIKVFLDGTELPELSVTRQLTSRQRWRVGVLEVTQDGKTVVARAGPPAPLTAADAVSEASVRLCE